MAIIFHTLQNLPLALENLSIVYFCTQAHSMCIGSIVNVPTCRDQFVKTQIKQLSWFLILREKYKYIEYLIHITDHYRTPRLTLHP